MKYSFSTQPKFELINRKLNFCHCALKMLFSFYKPTLKTTIPKDKRLFLCEIVYRTCFCYS